MKIVSHNPSLVFEEYYRNITVKSVHLLVAALLIYLMSILPSAAVDARRAVFRDCVTCPEMVAILPGEFMMGSAETEELRDSDEGPQHRVRISKSFSVGRYAVSFDEWDACAADGGCNGYKPSDNGWGRGKKPVINISWDDANAYAKWLSNKTGHTYRLLTEAEREYVTRAGTTSPFWWGSSISAAQANIDGNNAYGSKPTGQYRQKTVAVDRFKPNPWGLYNVHGNVWEWVQDCWHDSYVGAPIDGTAWLDDESGDYCKRVVRGGSWYLIPQFVRSATRSWHYQDYRSPEIGFRVARIVNSEN